MAQLPDYTALGATPRPIIARREPIVASYRPQTGFEQIPAEEAANAGQEMDTAARFALQAQEQHDATRVDAAFTALRQKQIDMTFGQNGFANLKGGDAVNRPLLKQYGGDFDQAAADLSAGLDNDNQRRIFMQRAQVAGLQLREDIARHVASQSDQYANDVFQSKLDTEVQAAASRWNAPDAAAVPLLNIQNSIHQYAERFGKPQEWVDDMNAKAQSKVYDGIIRQALANDPLIARGYIDKFGAKLTAADRAQLDYSIALHQRQMEARAQPAEAASDADAAVNAVAKASGDASGAPSTAKDFRALLGPAVTAAEENAEKRHPGDLAYRDLVVNRVRTKFALFSATQQAEQNAAVDKLEGILSATGGGQKPMTQDELFANPGAHDAYMKLDEGQKAGILAHLEHNARELEVGQTRGNPGLFNTLRQRIYLPDGDPSKINSYSQVIPYFSQGINDRQSDLLKKELVDAQNPELSSLMRKKNNYEKMGQQMLKSSLSKVAVQHPELAEEAGARYAEWVDQRVREERSAGRDPQKLFESASPGYVLNPNTVMSFLPTEAQVAAGKARAPAAAPAAGLPARQPGETPATYLKRIGR